MDGWSELDDFLRCQHCCWLVKNQYFRFTKKSFHYFYSLLQTNR